jgi:hypothetical protein
LPRRHDTLTTPAYEGDTMTTDETTHESKGKRSYPFEWWQDKSPAKWATLTFTIAEDLTIDPDDDDEYDFTSISQERRNEFTGSATGAYPNDRGLSAIYYYGALSAYLFGVKSSFYTMSDEQNEAFGKGCWHGINASTDDIDDDDLDPIHSEVGW